MTTTLSLGGQVVSVPIHSVIIAGWTGRDRAAVEEHIAELEALGVSRPTSTPVFYRVSASRLSVEEEIESTPASSGEVEPLLLQHAGRLWVGVGSDHTDREVEKYSVAVAKQLCDKPVGADWWPYDELVNHWDSLVLRAWVTEDGQEALYQQGTVDALLSAEDLLGRVELRQQDGTLMFCGTLPTRGGIRPASRFRFELFDPILQRRLSGEYAVRTIPLNG